MTNEQKEHTVMDPAEKMMPPQGFIPSLNKSFLSFAAIMPLLLGVIGLVGIFQTLASPALLAGIFQGNPVIDTFAATLAGSVAAGNPVVSYIIGGELLKQGVSLNAVTAFLLSWVTLGFVHLPLESATLGRHFTIMRNSLAFLFAMIIAVLTSSILRLVT